MLCFPFKALCCRNLSTTHIRALACKLRRVFAQNALPYSCTLINGIIISRGCLKKSSRNGTGEKILGSRGEHNQGRSYTTSERNGGQPRASTLREELFYATTRVVPVIPFVTRTAVDAGRSGKTTRQRGTRGSTFLTRGC